MNYLAMAEECYSGLNDASQVNIARIEAYIRAAVEAEREACAQICDDISTDRWEKFKGRGEHPANNEYRADPFMDGQSQGADACADAIRARGTA